MFGTGTGDQTRLILVGIVTAAICGVLIYASFFHLIILAGLGASDIALEPNVGFRALWKSGAFQAGKTASAQVKLTSWQTTMRECDRAAKVRQPRRPVTCARAPRAASGSV